MDETPVYTDDLLGFYDGFEPDYYQQDYFNDQVIQLQGTRTCKAHFCRYSAKNPFSKCTFWQRSILEISSEVILQGAILSFVRGIFAVGNWPGVISWEEWIRIYFNAN